MQFFNRRLRHSLAALTVSTALLSPYAYADITSWNQGKPLETEQLDDLQEHLKKMVVKMRETTVGIRMGGSQGSGVIISEDGYVLTAAHVSRQPGQTITIILNGGKTVKAKTLGAYFGMDASLVKIEGDGPFPYSEMGQSNTLKPGQWVVAMGHPGGYQPSRPAPLRLGRVLGNAPNGVQTDCLLINGDSGGPLFDLEGKVIGINSRISGNPKANIHVPIEAYHKNWEKLVNSESWGGRNQGLQRGAPYVGIGPTQDPDMFKVARVLPNSPAERAGVKVGDVVTKLDGKDIGDFRDLVTIVRRLGPGKKTKMEVMRGEKLITLNLTIGRFGEQAQRPAPPAKKSESKKTAPKKAESKKAEPKKSAKTDQTKKAAPKKDTQAKADAPEKAEKEAEKPLTEKEKKALERKKKREAKAKAQAEARRKAQIEARRKAMLEQQKMREQAMALQMDRMQKQIREMKVTVREKNHSATLDAFTPSVEKANEATVMIFAGKKQVAMGTVVNSNGYILTKASELREGLTVKFPSGPRMKAEVVGVVDGMDLAMLRVPATELHTIEWANGKAKLGTLIASADSEDAPMSFGVVSVEARKLHARGFLGIGFQPGSQEARVGRIMRKNMKDKTPLKTGDLITHVNGIPSANAAAVIETLSHRRPNEKVTLTLQRGDKTMKAEFVLLSREKMARMGGGQNPNQQSAAARSAMLGGELNDRRSDFTQVFQHDTFLYPEQVGGPVVGLDGKVLGINIARAGRIKSYALPADSVQPVLKAMMDGKHKPSKEFFATMKKLSVQDQIESTRLDYYRANFERMAAERKARQAQERLKRLENSLKN